MIRLLGLLFLSCAAATAAPNTVLIMADDLGFADLGCFGSEIETPNLDALAKEGLRFTQFYNTAKCHSSRVSLLTGLYCDQAGSGSLSRGATIAEVLRTRKVHSMMVGKWHLSKQPTDFGFDRYWGHLSGATNFFTGDDSFRLDGEKYQVPKTLNGKPFYTTTAIADFALEFLGDHAVSAEKQQPFFLYLAFNAPHYPLQAPEAAVKKYAGRYDMGWDLLRQHRHNKQLETGLLPAKWKLSERAGHVPAWGSLSAAEKAWESRRMEVYAAMVDVLDREIGRVITHLKQSGQYENTRIIFCSDNGACPFDRTRGKNLHPWDPKSYWCYDVGWAHAGNTPFRLYKQNQHEGGISSPLIVKMAARDLQSPPASAPADSTRRKTPLGEVTDQPAHLIDFMATLVELYDAAYPERVGARQVQRLQGKSLMPIIHGLKREAHDPLYFHFGTDRALRRGDWKLVAAKGGPWELYDLAADRTETTNLAASHPDRVQSMSKEWFRIAADVDRLPKRQLHPPKKEYSKLKFGLRADR